MSDPKTTGTNGDWLVARADGTFGYVHERFSWGTVVIHPPPPAETKNEPPPLPVDHSASHRPNKYLGDCCENCGRHISLPEFRSNPCDQPPGEWRLKRDRYVRKLHDAQRTINSPPRPRPEPYEGLRTGFGGLACGFIRYG